MLVIRYKKYWQKWMKVAMMAPSQLVNCDFQVEKD